MATSHQSQKCSLHRLSSYFLVKFLDIFFFLKPQEVRVHFVTGDLQSILIIIIEKDLHCS